MKIFIGIPAKNEGSTILIAINSLRQSIKKAQKAFPDLEYKILVCVNNSTDDTEKIIKEHTKGTQDIELFVIKTTGKLEAIVYMLDKMNFHEKNNSNLLAPLE